MTLFGVISLNAQPLNYYQDKPQNCKFHKDHIII